jgi:hypothetical protein
MQISANTSVKTIEGHYTYACGDLILEPSIPLCEYIIRPFTWFGRCYTKSVVTKAQNVLVLRDVHCARYVAGGNCKFFGDEGRGDNGVLKDISPDKAKASIGNRLSFNDEGGDYESMLCFALDAAGMAVMASKTAISLSDRILPWETTPDGGGAPAAVVDARAGLGLNTIHYGQARIEAT